MATIELTSKIFQATYAGQGTFLIDALEALDTENVRAELANQDTKGVQDLNFNKIPRSQIHLSSRSTQR